MTNPLLKIQEFGQSIGMDFIRRRLITSGGLRQLIQEDGLRGVTSNPKIFDQVIAGSHDYDDDIRAMALQGRSIEEIYRTITVRDVQMAADQFRPLYDESEGAHGFVILEVTPHLAHDMEGTVTEAFNVVPPEAYETLSPRKASAGSRPHPSSARRTWPHAGSPWSPGQSGFWPMRNRWIRRLRPCLSAGPDPP